MKLEMIIENNNKTIDKLSAELSRINNNSKLIDDKLKSDLKRVDSNPKKIKSDTDIVDAFNYVQQYFKSYDKGK